MKHDDALSTLVRPVFRGDTLLICDYGQIEARGVAWVSGQSDQLELFRRKQDVYLDMASSIFGRPCSKTDKVERHIGKTLVLGAGYGLSGPRFNLYCALANIDLSAAGTSGEACIKAYREKNSLIVRQWREYDRAAKDVVAGRGDRVTGKCRFSYNGNLLITLPSGRTLTYRNARMEDKVPPYCAAMGLPLEPRPTVVYANPKGHPSDLYGGKITENIVQAICRDLLATALVNCERAGLRVVLHVHDEIVCEGVVEQLDTLADIMCRAPSWADGFPIAVEGFTCAHYVKAPWSDSRRVER